MTLMSYYKESENTAGVKSYTTETNLPLPSEVRRKWCFGLSLADDTGTEMSDEMLVGFLKGAVREMERRIGVYLIPKVIRANPGERGLVKGVDYHEAEPPYDYEVRSYRNWGFLQLRQRRVQSLESFKMVLPNGMTIIDFYRDDDTKKWVKLYPEAGQVNIVPYAGDPTIFALLGGSQSGYPFVTGQINSNLPQMFHVDYTAGYAPYEIPDDIRNIIAKMASIDALGIAGDAVLAGISSQSLGMDGVSESLSTSASATSGTYTSHIIQYQKEIDKFFSPKGGGARTSERGITMTGL